MKIAEVRTDPSVLPKIDKEWRFALAASSQSEGWIVSIIAEDGTVGYGSIRRPCRIMVRRSKR